jgi:hypothetical protein
MKNEALNLKRSLQTDDNLIGALRNCFLFQGRIDSGCSKHVRSALSFSLEKGAFFKKAEAAQAGTAKSPTLPAMVLMHERSPCRPG